MADFQDDDWKLQIFAYLHLSVATLTITSGIIVLLHLPKKKLAHQWHSKYVDTSWSAFNHYLHHSVSSPISRHSTHTYEWLLEWGWPCAHLVPLSIHPVMQHVGTCKSICLDSMSIRVRESIERESTTSMEIATLPPKHTGWGCYKEVERPTVMLHNSVK